MMRKPLDSNVNSRLDAVVNIAVQMAEGPERSDIFRNYASAKLILSEVEAILERESSDTALVPEPLIRIHEGLSALASLTNDAVAIDRGRIALQIQYHAQGLRRPQNHSTI